MNLTEIKLNEENFKHFHNKAWKPDWELCKHDMDKDEFNKALAEWQLCENDVLFDGVSITYESCDCGDGYGCSHGQFPYEIKIEGYKIESDMEEDRLCIYHKWFSFSLMYDEATLQDFVDACRICRIEVKLKP